MITKTTADTGSASWIKVLCWLTVTLEGFDIVALAAALPTILETRHVGMGPVRRPS